MDIDDVGVTAFTDLDTHEKGLDAIERGDVDPVIGQEEP